MAQETHLFSLQSRWEGNSEGDGVATGQGWETAYGLPAALGGKARVLPEVPALVAALAAELEPGDRVVVMSNGGFAGLHGRLLDVLRERSP